MDIMMKIASFDLSMSIHSDTLHYGPKLQSFGVSNQVSCFQKVKY